MSGMSLDMKETEKSIDPERSSSRSSFNGGETVKRGREGTGDEDESVTKKSDLRNPFSKVDGAFSFEEDPEAHMGALKHGSSATSLQSDPSESGDDPEKTPNSEGSPFAVPSRRPPKARTPAALLRRMSLEAKSSRHTTTHAVHEDPPLGEGGDETPEEPAGDAPGADSQENVIVEESEKVNEKEEKSSTETEVPVDASSTPAATGGFVFGQNLSSRVANAAATGAGFSGLGGFAALAQSSGGGSGSAPAPTGFLFAHAMQQAQTAATPDARTPAVNGKAPGAPDEAAEPVVSLAESARKEYEAKSHGPLFREVDVVTGEEGEFNVFEMNVKLYVFDKSSQQWKERGRAAARLNDADDASYSRLVVRMAGTLRIIINNKVWREMSVTKLSDRNVSFTAFDATEDEEADRDNHDKKPLPKVFLMTCSAADADTFHTELTSRLRQLTSPSPSKAESGPGPLDRSDTSLDPPPLPPKKPKWQEE